MELFYDNLWNYFCIDPVLFSSFFAGYRLVTLNFSKNNSKETKNLFLLVILCCE